MSASLGERLVLLRVRKERRPVLQILSGRGWLGGPPAPGGSQIKRNGEEVDVGLSEVAFPGLGPWEGMLGVPRKLADQLVMGCCFFLSFIFICYSSSLLRLFFSKL